MISICLKSICKNCPANNNFPNQFKADLKNISTALMDYMVQDYPAKELIMLKKGTSN